jgi:hypothetical protein
MKTDCPKYIEERYPNSAKNWESWLNFLEWSKKYFGTMDAAREWFETLDGPTDAHHRSSGSGSSSTLSKHPFPWATASKHSHDYLGTTIALDFETANYYGKTLLEMTND